MRKNKTIAYMLAATLLVGGTFVGTKALFTDVDNAVGEISLSTGDVDVEVTSDGWELSRNGAEYKDNTTITSDTSDKDGEVPGKSDKFEFETLANNLKPGDVLTKKVTVKNIGTLMAKLDLVKNTDKMTQQLGVLKGLVTATESKIDLEDRDENGLLSPGEIAIFTLTLTVDESVDSQHNATTGHNTDDIENTRVDLTDAWVLTATQQNKYE